MGLVFVAFILVAGGVAVASLYYSRGARLKRTLRQAPRLSIENVSEREPAKIVGSLAYIGEPLISPLTGRTCAYYEILVEEYHSGADDDGYWETMIRESQGQNFVINDDTGTAIVNPIGAQVALTIDSRTKSGTFDAPTDRERNYLNSHGQEGKGWVFNKSLRYREGILEAGERVAVLGRGVREPDPEGVQQASGYRSTPPMRLRMRGSQNAPLLISDDTSTVQ